MTHNDNIYHPEIYSYLRKSECRQRLPSRYIQHQPYINESTRASLVEWLVQLALMKNLPTSTLYLAVSYVDRILLLWTVKTEELISTALVVTMIAYKVDHDPEINVKDYLAWTENNYTKNQTLQLEKSLLKVLDFDLILPTAYDFLTYFTINHSEKVRFLSMYLCELTLMETHPHIEFLPSFLAAAVVAVSQHTLKKTVWPIELEAVSGYKLTEIQDCFFHIENTFKSPQSSNN